MARAHTRLPAWRADRADCEAILESVDRVGDPELPSQDSSPNMDIRCHEPSATARAPPNTLTRERTLLDAHTQAAQPRSGTLGGFLRRGALAIVLCIILGAAAGLAATALLPKKYTAAASVLVSATGVDEATQTANGRTSGVINLDTEAQLVRSADVVARAQKMEPKVPRGNRRHVVKHVEVAVPANTTVLNISFTASTAASAQASANAFAQAYLADRKATAESSLDRQVDNAEQSVESLTLKLKQLSEAESGLPKNSRQRIFDDAQRSLLTSQISTINQRLISLRSTQITPGRVLSSAPRPSSPSSPSRILNLASGLAVGLVIGLLVAWLRLTHRRRIRRASDLEHAVDVPMVGEVRVLDASAPLAMASQEAEVYRRLSILTMAAIKGRGCVVISAAGSSRSDSAIASNLATTLASGGVSTCMLRVNPLGESQTTPLVNADVEVVTADRAEAIRHQFGGGSTQDALMRLRGEREVLVVDAPCPTQTADAQTLAVLSDAVLMVVDSGTRTKAVRESLAAFDAVAAPMLGIVLVHARKGRAQDRPQNAGKVRVHPDPVLDGKAESRSSEEQKETPPSHSETQVRADQETIRHTATRSQRTD